MDGLAQQMAQPQGRGQGQGQGRVSQSNLPTVDEVIQLLMQGATPQQLLEMGIPEALIMQAIQILEQQMAQQQASAPVTEAGLAQTMAG